MGQTLSHGEPQGGRSREQLRRELARKFADRCFTSLELYSLKDNFKSLADVQPNAGSYLKEDTIVRFLEVPDALQVSPILFHMISFLGSFPFLNDAPVVLGLEETVIVVTLLTERYKRVLSNGAADRGKLLFKSLAVYDRKLSEAQEQEEGREDAESHRGAQEPAASSRSHASGFVIDEAGDDEADDDLQDEDDDLVLSALQSLDYVDALKVGNPETIHGAMIPADNFRSLITLLLLIAPLGAQERLSEYPLDADRLRSVADSVLAAFLNVEKSPGIKFRAFNRVLESLPFMFDGFGALFEHFLFSRNLDLAKKTQNHDAIAPKPVSPTPVVPLLLEKGSILNHAVLSQLSFFIPGSDLFRRLRLLYSGDKDGFSMGSFETTVFNWRAPTILLVRGTRLSPADAGNGHGSEERFTASLPPKRFPDGSSGSDRVTYGLYVRQPWRLTHKDCFGDADSLLFQLEPVHDVFRASTLNRDCVTFARPGGAGAGITGVAAGNPPPRPSASYGRRAGDGGGGAVAALGPVSLLLDGSFEFGVFTHDYTSRGGAFQSSVSRRFDFQDRFEVESLEVWGCGGDEEAKVQAERWAFEAREAEARRRINLGTGDIEADRALLEMAGLVGANRSGGSMA